MERLADRATNDLPNRPTLRVSEVAWYYGVTERTVYLWIENGKLKTEKTPAGQWRVTRESLDSCRFAGQES